MRLLLKDEFMLKVKSGKKTSTIRRGTRFPDSRELILQSVKTNETISKTIKSIQYKELQCITNRESVRDGFVGIAELADVIKEIYPDIKPTEIMTIIEW